MNAIRFARFASTLLIGLLAARAQAAEPRSISLEECFQLALEKNLDIRIQRLTPEITRASVYGSYGAYEPTFNAGMSYRSSTQPGGFDEQNRPFGQAQSKTESFNAGITGLLPTGTRYDVSLGYNDVFGAREIAIDGVPIGVQQFENTSGGIRLSLTQPLLRNFWIDAPRLNIQLSQKNLQISELTLRNQIIATVTAVELAYLELVAARENIGVSEVALQLAEQLLRENQKRVEVGVLAPLDEKEAQSQVAASRANLLGARNNYSIRQNQLKSLLGDHFVSWHDAELLPAESLTAEPQTYSLQDSWSKGMTLRPDLQQARLDLERRHITLKYQKNQLFPQLDLVGSYGQGGSGREFSDAFTVTADGNYPEYSFGAILSVPLGGNRQARSNVRATQAEIEQSLLRLKKLEQDIMVQISDGIAQARTSYQQVQATEEAAAFALEALRAEEKKLENGKSTSFQVLQLQRILTERRFANIRARVDYNAALARLAQAEGSTLERQRINLEIR